MGTIITVSSAAGLTYALAHATGGETIQLAAGDYGKLALNPYSGFNVAFPSNVTITSADPLHPASFSGLDLRSVANLTIDSVVCNYKFTPGDPLYTAPFSVTGGANIAITDSTFNGDVASGMTSVDNGFPTGIGLSVRGVTGVTLAGNDVSSFYRGVAVSTSNNVNVTGNDVHGIRMDGMDFCQIQGGNIAGNHIHDFHTSPLSLDHSDMIQFWTAGTTAPSTDINITGNVLDIGTGGYTQSIFMRNELVDTGVAGPSMYYQNINISNNLITNAQLHGITVGETNGLTISQNSVLHADGNLVDGADATVEIPQINVAAASTNVSITGNATAGINGYTSQAGWVINHNAFVQDQTLGAPGYYGDVFVSSSLTSHDGVHLFLALPGAMIDLLGAGAAATRDYLPAAGAVAALFQSVEDHAGSMQTRTFDASLSLTSLGTLPAGTLYQWTFGDGTTATGQKVIHTFGTGGYYDVSLTVILPGGATDTTTGSIGIEGSNIVTLGSDGYLRATDYGTTVILPGGPFNSATGIQLGAPGVTAVIARAHVADLLLEKDFDIALQLHADSRTSYGEVFRLNGSITAFVSTNGELTVQTKSSDGSQIQLTSTGISMTDLKVHAIDIRLHNGLLQLWVDGHVAAQSAFAGTMGSYGTLDMTFGNPWGQKNFYGDLSGFNIRAGELALAQGQNILSLGSDSQFHSGTTTITTTTDAQALTLITDSLAPPVADLHLGDIGRVANVQTALLGGLIASHAFDVSMHINADSIASAGTIFRMDNSIAARVSTTGELLVRAFDDAGQLHTLTTTGGHLTDLASHAVDIRLTDGKLQLWLDGTLANETDFAGTLHTTTGTGLNFGNLIASSNFAGHLTGFDIAVSDAPDSGALGYHASDWATTVA